jgi:hypothetical protein
VTATQSLFPSLDEQLESYLSDELDLLLLWDWVSERVWEDEGSDRRLTRVFLLLSEHLDGVRSEQSVRNQLERLALLTVTPKGKVVPQTRSSAVIQHERRRLVA